nr:probable protein phosphatase 2C 49 [Ipomoea batatas]
MYWRAAKHHIFQERLDDNVGCVVLNQYTNDLNRLIKKYKFSSKHSFRWPLPCSFYAVFDGHGGSAASAYVKDNASRFFFEDAALPQASVVDKAFLEELGPSHHRAFLLANQALADYHSIDCHCKCW